ncbi:heme NO-binding domain-containing protein [soil metagenome]
MVEEVVTDHHVEEAWEDVLGSAGLAGAYTSLGTYPDDDLSRIVCAGSAALSTPEDALLRDLGRCSLAKLAVRYPGFFNDVIHAKVRKLYPDAEVPHFAIDDSCPDAVGLGYDSPRRLCYLAEGFVHGAADHFGEHALIEQTTCMYDGDDHCTLRCSFLRSL